VLAGNNGSADPYRHDSAHGAKAGDMTTFSNALFAPVEFSQWNLGIANKRCQFVEEGHFV